MGSTWLRVSALSEHQAFRQLEPPLATEDAPVGDTSRPWAWNPVLNRSTIPVQANSDNHEDPPGEWDAFHFRSAADVTWLRPWSPTCARALTATVGSAARPTLILTGSRPRQGPTGRSTYRISLAVPC